MMKCPKCLFEQPPDTYCAQCGVNMETYRPAPIPKLRSLLTNWMVHLAVLISVIVGLVLYDRDKKPRSASQEALVSQASYRRNAKASKEPEALAPTAAEEKSTLTASHKEPRPAPFRKSLNPETLADAEQATPVVPTPAPAKTAAATPAPIQGMNVTFYHASRNALAELQKDARTISIGGDGMGGILWKKQFDDLVSAGEIKNVARNSYKDFQVNQSIVIFKGQRSATGKNIGLNFQVTPVKKDTTNASLEVKGWSNIQDATNDDALFSSEMTLNTQYLGFIAGFLPKNRPLNDEEKVLFDSDRTLKIYNTPGFWDDAVDLIMVIEFTAKP